MGERKRALAVENTSLASIDSGAYALMTAMMSGFHGRYGGFSQQTWSKKTKFLIPCSGRTVASNERNELADKNNKGAAFGSNLFAYRSAEKFLSVAENQMGAKKIYAIRAAAQLSSFLTAKFYNRVRRHSTIKYLSPNDHELQGGSAA